ncbi:Ger(x)C family spore germination protein [Caloramator australicus]|uniref:Spore germination protein GerKC n=1 Tax=Caloramator australicus RC3 TaxID=857293 RepID=G0V497_9CLOT|nr:Ger(x)C family spore germination protein [Caloramator australicus]CCC57937.1 Spore germination protein GerKC [Caloramator australicus RC3]
MVKTIKLTLLSFIILLLTSCWNYKEIDKIAPAAGVSFDYDEKKNSYILTVEIVNLKNTSTGTELLPEYFTSEGKTILDAIRNMISVSGRKIYWSHAKVVFISEKIAKRGIIDVLDFIERDTEVRTDMKIVLVKGKKASEIFNTSNKLEKIVSYHVDEMLENSIYLSKYPKIELWDLINQIQFDISTAILPVAYIVEDNDRKIINISGSAIFKEAKMIAFLNDADTKNLLFLRNKVYGGILPLNNVLGTESSVSFEIYKSKTKVKPILIDNKILFKINLSVDVALKEVSGQIDFIEEKKLESLKNYAQEKIKNDILNTFYYVRDTYNLDVFGFSKLVKINYPQFWKNNIDRWESLFSNSELDIDIKLNIIGTSTTNKIIKVGK